MYSRIKIVSGLLSVIFVFILLQLVSSGLMFTKLGDNSDSINYLNSLQRQRLVLTQSWVNLLQARSDLNRSINAYLLEELSIKDDASAADLIASAKGKFKAADEAYDSYRKLMANADVDKGLFDNLLKSYEDYRVALTKLAEYAEKGDLNGFYAHRTSGLQAKFEEQFGLYFGEISSDFENEVVNAESNYRQSLYLLVILSVLLAVISVISYRYVRKGITEPLNTLIERIKVFASGI